MVWQGRIMSGEGWKRQMREDLSRFLIANVPWRILQWDQDTGVPWHRGCPHSHPALSAVVCTLGRAPLVPKRPPSKPHTAPLPSVLLLFQFNFVLVSLGSWPGDMDGSKLPANKRNFSRTVLVGL